MCIGYRLAVLEFKVRSYLKALNFVLYVLIQHWAQGDPGCLC